ncbi:polysaccharide lyase family 14 protein [Hydnomerulius pinastri MD-312]|uniref:Polysaccharide lyase family 14 protein n=1 Tax=Hydnomerulius pinastri MD-312 TaxID=994086 RepID=A0A0C9W7S4_9AGAM|nr:polysaccharide lyase family 14 protein [Hydnomerulius pinastri MD-312]
MYAVQSFVLLILGFLAIVNALPTAGHNHIRSGHHHVRSGHNPVRESHKHVRRTCKPSAPTDLAAEPTASSIPSSIPSIVPSATPTTSTSSKSESTATSSSSSPQSSSTGSSSSPVTPASKIVNALFPVKEPSGNSGWTTAPEAPNPIPLSDSTLNPTHILSELSHDYVNAPDGKLGMKAHYPEGSYTLTREPKGGISFYAPGPDNVDLTTAKEATFGYSVYFDEDFGWQKGGKLPGLYGGDSAEGSISCSGGSRNDACFSARLMWRSEGQGEIYTYLPPSYSANNAVCDVPPYSECNPSYGASVGRGAFSFQSGQWNTVSQRVRLNDVGQANGELELYIEGQSVINVGGLVLRDSEEGKIRGIQMQTFFGGSEEDFACPKDQNSYFADFTVAITETL